MRKLGRKIRKHWKKILKEKQDKEESVVSEQKTLTVPYPETEANVPITVYMGQGTAVISGTSSPAASTNPLNTAAGSLDLNTVNFFQQLLMQQNQMQQQNQTFMTQVFQSMSGS